MNEQDKDVLLAKIVQMQELNSRLYNSVDSDLVHYCESISEGLDSITHYIVDNTPRKRKRVAK